MRARRKLTGVLVASATARLPYHGHHILQQTGDIATGEAVVAMPALSKAD
ncbi:hypothetical protein QYS46_27380 [Klebsiella michiganensis]|nr:hypothetical protein [Klebsiella michiganensis]